MYPARNIYEQQAYNRRLTVVIMLVFILFVGLLGFGFDFLYLGTINDEVFFPVATGVALLASGGSAFWSLRSGAKAVLTSTGAVPADPGNPAHRQFLNIVDEMSIASGLPHPQAYVVPDADPNAFATGQDPQHSAIAVTQGLLDNLNRDELQGVIAHEMSHIRNFDTRLMTVIAALVGTVLILADWAARSMRFGGRGSSRGRSSRSGGNLGPILLVIWIIGMILAPIIARIMAMAVSRQREYLADASGAELTRNPLGLASALRKIDGAVAPTASIKRAAAHLCIADPQGRAVNSKEGFIAELFGTHPPIQKRLIALEAMAYKYAPAQ